MNKNYRIITINGIKGLVMVCFIILGLIAGFIISPAWVCMQLSNIFIIKYTSILPINLYQGLLIWFVIALSFYALNRNKKLIGFGSYTGLTPEQLRSILKRAKNGDESIIDNLKTIDEKKIDTKNIQEQNSETKEEIRG